MKLGEKIKLVRKQRGMTQRELGERLHLDGNAANRIAQYESGFRTPKEGRIQEIARVLNEPGNSGLKVGTFLFISSQNRTPIHIGSAFSCLVFYAGVGCCRN